MVKLNVTIAEVKEYVKGLVEAASECYRAYP